MIQNLFDAADILKYTYYPSSHNTTKMRILFSCTNPYQLNHLKNLFMHTRINYNFLPVIMEQTTAKLVKTINVPCVVAVIDEVEANSGFLVQRGSASIEDFIPMTPVADYSLLKCLHQMFASMRDLQDIEYIIVPLHIGIHVASVHDAYVRALL